MRRSRFLALVLVILVMIGGGLFAWRWTQRGPGRCVRRWSRRALPRIVNRRVDTAFVAAPARRVPLRGQRE